MIYTDQTFSLLLKRGFVMGKLSSETIDFIKKKKVIKRVRAAVIKKGIPVFSNPKEPDSIELNSDKTRKMLVFNNVEQIKALPIIKNAVKLILRDINAHAIFGTSKIRSKLTCKLNSNDAAISFMVDGFEKQMTHTDYRKQPIRSTFGKDADKTVREQMPLVLLLAFEDNTSLGYYPNFHNQIMSDSGSDKDAEIAITATEEQYINLFAYEYVIFHPLFVHFGTKYKKNTRLHLYMDSPLCARETYSDGSPQTFPVVIGDDISPYGDPSIVNVDNVKVHLIGEARAWKQSSAKRKAGRTLAAREAIKKIKLEEAK